MEWLTKLRDLSFPEGPRWHDGRLWLSDFYRHQVLALDDAGDVEVMAEVPGQPSGLGWLPDGRLLVVSMRDRRLLRADAGGLVVHADLSAVATASCNDMVVDGQGRAYVGNFGFERHDGEAQRDADLALVHPDGRVEVAASEMAFPNGSVVSEDGATLIVAETHAQRLTAFTIAPDGTLSGRRVFADLGANYPDGICLDEQGAVWVADPRGGEVLRVREGGEVTARLSTAPLGAYACMLGGAQRTTLYVCANTGSGPQAAGRREGVVLAREVDVPGAGWP